MSMIENQPWLVVVALVVLAVGIGIGRIRRTR